MIKLFDRICSNHSIEPVIKKCPKYDKFALSYLGRFYSYSKMEVYDIFKFSNLQIFKSSHFQILFLNTSFDGIVDYLIDIGSDIEV